MARVGRNYSILYRKYFATCLCCVVSEDGGETAAPGDGDGGDLESASPELHQTDVWPQVPASSLQTSPTDQNSAGWRGPGLRGASPSQ